MDQIHTGKEPIAMTVYEWAWDYLSSLDIPDQAKYAVVSAINVEWEKANGWDEPIDAQPALLRNELKLCIGTAAQLKTSEMALTLALGRLLAQTLRLLSDKLKVGD